MFPGKKCLSSLRRLREKYMSLVDAVVNLDEKTALQIAEEMLKAGVDPVKVLENCRRGMSMVGERFERGEMFLSEMIMAAEVFKEVMEIVEPKLKKEATKSLGRFLIGTVQEDIHDMGKNIVIALLEAEGFEVIDLGVDVPPEKFVEAIRQHKPSIVGMSGLLTIAIESMKKTVDAIKERGLRDKVKIVIGGGIIDENVQGYAGADAYANNAAKGVGICKELIGG
jgi:methylmalonyl-CoA mutase cobalamin-binding domain/chain